MQHQARKYLVIFEKKPTVPLFLKKTLDRLPYSHAQASVTHNQTKRSIKRFDGNATVERAV
ncbi:hypothetical protein DPMN_043964 [Dreissena polymorpha]|uniref:Uncharacterized protein n=1 Tax=Dreissena polymorpha TaxID=45954 RepID=A0A9D4HYE6_DREPO|nr:hypothetical protein DPMN_043964 [Dreissena polymorpha]